MKEYRINIVDYYRSLLIFILFIICAVFLYSIFYNYHFAPWSLFVFVGVSFIASETLSRGVIFVTIDADILSVRKKFFVSFGKASSQKIM